MRGKRIISALLITVLCMGTALQVSATGIDETKKKAEELESKKKAAEEEKSSLAAQLDSIVSEMESTKAEIDEKEAEIEKKEEELIQAKVDENDQYESMKKRIQFMYENGNAQFLEVLFQSKTLGDLLNNAEYISTISQYDRNMLVEFQKIVKDVEDQEKALQDEYDELETMQNDLIAKQDSINSMLDSKNAEISQLESEIGATADKLASLEAAAAAASRKQNEATQTYSGSAGASVVSGNGTFTHPCPGYTYISSEFGWRAQPLPGASSNHKGMDFAASTGTPIYAAASGSVVSAGYSGNAGNLIIINHGNGLQTYYMHCNNIYVRAGQSVSKGQNIGAVGTTGNSTGPHLHFQVMSGGIPVNPRNYL